MNQFRICYCVYIFTFFEELSRPLSNESTPPDLEPLPQKNKASQIVGQYTFNDSIYLLLNHELVLHTIYTFNIYLAQHVGITSHIFWMLW